MYQLHEGQGCQGLTPSFYRSSWSPGWCPCSFLHKRRFPCKSFKIDFVSWMISIWFRKSRRLWLRATQVRDLNGGMGVLLCSPLAWGFEVATDRLSSTTTSGEGDAFDKFCIRNHFDNFILMDQMPRPSFTWRHSNVSQILAMHPKTVVKVILVIPEKTRLFIALKDWMNYEWTMSAEKISVICLSIKIVEEVPLKTAKN